MFFYLFGALLSNFNYGAIHPEVYNSEKCKREKVDYYTYRVDSKNQFLSTLRPFHRR